MTPRPAVGQNGRRLRALPQGVMKHGHPTSPNTARRISLIRMLGLCTRGLANNWSQPVSGTITQHVQLAQVSPENHIGTGAGPRTTTATNEDCSDVSRSIEEHLSSSCRSPRMGDEPVPCLLATDLHVPAPFISRFGVLGSAREEGALRRPRSPGESDALAASSHQPWGVLVRCRSSGVHAVFDTMLGQALGQPGHPLFDRETPRHDGRQTEPAIALIRFPRPSLAENDHR